MKLLDFHVEFLGIEFPDYFQGYGLGPHSPYTHCTYGIGDTEEEALEDCLEIMSQEIDLTKEDEARIRTDYSGNLANKTTAAKALGYESETDYPAYYHVGIKWTATI